MAHFVQKIIVAAFVISVASAADFSHRDHLGYGLACTQCHVSVPTSTRADDNNLPRPEACLTCHASGMPIKSPRATVLAHFSHEKHVKILDCQKCHGGTDVALPKMADCIACHPQNDIPNGCWQCHSQSMQLKPATHVDAFVDSHSRVKRADDAKAACRVCHGQNFRCAGCH